MFYRYRCRSARTLCVLIDEIKAIAGFVIDLIDCSALQLQGRVKMGLERVYGDVGCPATLARHVKID